MSGAVQPRLHGYVAMFNGKRLEVYAGSSLEARDKAVEHFKPAKSKRHMVHVTLAEFNGQPVVHTPDF